MSHRRAEEVLEESYLSVRAKILEVAATLDRIDRGAESESLADDERRSRISQAIDILSRSSGAEGKSRAEDIQQLFSRPYEADWRKIMEV